LKDIEIWTPVQYRARKQAVALSVSRAAIARGPVTTNARGAVPANEI